MPLGSVKRSTPEANREEVVFAVQGKTYEAVACVPAFEFLLSRTSREVSTIAKAGFAINPSRQRKWRFARFGRSRHSRALGRFRYLSYSLQNGRSLPSARNLLNRSATEACLGRCTPVKLYCLIKYMRGNESQFRSKNADNNRIF